MNTVDKIIHNALLRRQGMFLPSVGDLVVERVAGKMMERGEVASPAWRVVFSKNRHEGLLSLEALIEQELELDAQSAQTLYNRWLIEAKRDNAIIIEGVGKIANGFFTPTKSFATLINPFAGTTLRLKRNSLKPILNAIVIAVSVCVIGVILLVGTGILVVSDGSIKYMSDSELEIAVPAPSVEPLPPMPVVSDSLETVVGDSTIEVKDTVVSVPQQAEVEPAKPDVQMTAGVTYHLVGGVFSTTENADKCIASVRSKDGKLPVVKIPFKGDKILVSIYSSQNNEVVEAKKRELESVFPDVWVYKQVIK